MKVNGFLLVCLFLFGWFVDFWVDLWADWLVGWLVDS